MLFWKKFESNIKNNFVAIGDAFVKDNWCVTSWANVK